MKKVLVVLLGILILGCAKLTVGTKDPIQVDINMRVDVYQHVVEEAESINEQIYGNDKFQKFNHLFFELQNVYAASLSLQIEEAIEKRKQRAELVKEYMKRGYIGENKNALLEVLEDNVSEELKSKVKEITEKENKDRLIIYEAVAEKNDVSRASVEKIFLKQDYKRAPQGVWFQIYSQEKNKYIWVKK